jgi:diguanylate cyclase (GGDEF)-like protein
LGQRSCPKFGRAALEEAVPDKESWLDRFDLTGDLPEVIKIQLNETIFAEPSLFGVFAAVLVLATPILWLRTHDEWLVAFAAVAAFLSTSRMILTLLLARFYRQNGAPGLTACVAILVSVLSALALAVAGMTVRAAYLEEVVSIEIATIALAAYVVGSVSRGAGAFPKATILLSVLMFAPPIAAAIAAGTLAYGFIALILANFFVATVRLILIAHGRMRAQLLAEYRLSLVARTDHLTGLANRSGFEERGLHSLESGRCIRSGCVVAVIDLDGFKAVNDTHGHRAGDDLLKEVAIRIKDTLEAGHFPVRLGGDEFAVLFDPDTSLEQAIALSRRLVAALKLPYAIGAARLHISGSVGVACFENETDTFAAIVERADKALYRAKSAGKNQVQSLRVAGPASGFGPRPETGRAPGLRDVVALH